MKTVFIFLASCLIALSSLAGTVMITLNGNKHYEVVVNGKSYFTNAYNISTTNANKSTITIHDLQNGQHSIQVYRINNNNKRNNGQPLYSSVFTLRPEYDVRININGNNGRVRINETRNRNNGSNPDDTYKTPMSDADFNVVYNSVRTKWFQSAKVTSLQDAFNKTGNYFTTYQIRQLLQLIKNENSRLELAKLSYKTVTDPRNFSQVYDLFTIQTNRDELDKYVKSYRA